jgi:hypothetical protein
VEPVAVLGVVGVLDIVDIVELDIDVPVPEAELA